MEEYLRSQPAVQASFQAAQGQGRSALWWVAAAMLAALLAYIVLTGK